MTRDLRSWIWPLGLLVLLGPTSAAAVEGTFSASMYGPGTDLYAQPQPAKVKTQTIGEVGIRIATDPLLGFRFRGMIDTFLQPPEIGHFSLNAASVHYEFGFTRPLRHDLDLTYLHGSWHQLDGSGFIPKYNRIGLEFKFKTGK